MRRIAAKYLYPLTSAEPVVNGFVELEEDGTVIRTGVCADPAAEPVFYDGAVAPGFVNAHCHVELSYMKGLFRKGTGMAGFIDQINELRDTKSLEEKVRDLTVAMDSLWEQGVVAMADISNCDDSFAVKARHPMYTRTFLEVFGTEPEDCGAVMDGVRKLKAVADGFGIDAAPTPHACYTMSPELVTAVSVEGLKSGFLSFHSEETEEEEEMLKYGSGKMWENRRKAGMSVPPVTGKSSLLYFIDRLLAGRPAPFDEHILLVHECCMDQEGIDAAKAVMNPELAEDLRGHGFPFVQRRFEPRGRTLLPPAELPGSPARGTAHLGLPQRGGIPGQAGVRRPGTGPPSGIGFHRPPGCGRPPDCRV